MKNTTRLAFTLVELIVVITILAVLGTIGFISFQGYTVQARDSKRINDISSLTSSLEYYSLTEGSYPFPDDFVTISASGSIVGRQGNLGEGVANTIRFPDAPRDPITGEYYSYYVFKSGTHMQILGFMEKLSSTMIQDLLPQGYSGNYSNGYPKVYGNKLGILTDIDNTPVQSLTGSTDIDILLTGTGYIAHVSNEISITGTGSELRYSVPLSSCQRIADLNQGGANGYYDIYPNTSEAIEVYCDFTSDPDGGVLTMIARSVDDITYNGTPFGWFVSRGSARDDTAPYSLGESIKHIPFQKVYLGVYDTGKNITGFTTLDVNDLDIFDGTYSNTPLAVEGCQGEPINIVGFGTIDSCMAFNLWGKFSSTESYWFSYNPSAPNDGLNRRRYGSSFPYPGIIFVK